VSNLQIVS